MKKLILIAIATVSSIASWAQRDTKIATGPWLQAVDENEFTVMWTSTEDAIAWVEIAPDDGTHFYATDRQKFYQSELGRKPIGKLHKVRVNGLDKGTAYRYRIMMQAAQTTSDPYVIKLGRSTGSNVYTHAPYRTRTLDADKQQVKFAVGNDFHANREIFDLLFGEISKGGYDFVCLNGDMTSSIDSTSAITAYYLDGAAKSFASEIPLYMARGNHETRGCEFACFMDYFPTTTGLPYYTFRQGPVFFIVLDSGEDKPDSDIGNNNIALYDPYRRQQAEWLNDVVNSDEFKQSPVRIVFCHIPPEPKGWHGNIEVNELFCPILDKAGIDLMICGHIHAYRFEDKGTHGRNFPVICNPNRCRMDVEASVGNIGISIFDKTGAKIKELSIKK